LKDSFFKGLIAESKEEIKLKDLTAQLEELNNHDMFNTKEKQIQKIELEIAKIKTKINNKVYDNAFEWRFIFPEALNAEGDFIGFDVIIGNPPYIQIQNFSGQDIQLVLQNSGYETFEKTGDIYALFIEKGISLLRQNGLLSFITSNKWMRAGYGQSLRHFLATKTQPLKLIDFAGFQVFDSATVDSNILITQKTESALPFVACTIQKDYNSEIDLTTYFAEHSQQMPLMSANAWVISSNIEQQIKAKMEAKGTPLKDWDINIYRGVLTGLNEAFIIDTETKERLCSEDENSEKIIKPILRGRDIKKYCAEWAGLWLINSHNNPPVKIDDYPAIKKHLDNFYSQLEERGDKGATPYNLRNCAYLKEFEKKKIVWADLSRSGNCFTFDDKNLYLQNTGYIMTGTSLKYILAVLNTKIMLHYLDAINQKLDSTGWRWINQYVEILPIPKLSSLEQKPFIALVNKILKAKKAGQDTHDLETQIDNLVYDLYGLTEQERAIVEG
jgi:adenine-specific DNA-methyltransferase